MLSHARGTLGLSGHERLHVTPYPYGLLYGLHLQGESSLESTEKEGLGEGWVTIGVMGEGLSWPRALERLFKHR